jgi:integrase
LAIKLERAKSDAGGSPGGGATAKLAIAKGIDPIAERAAARRAGKVPAFGNRLRERDATAALALEFAILTAARPGEVLGCRWSEIDLKDKTDILAICYFRRSEINLAY